MVDFDNIKSINELPPNFNIIEIIINAIKTNNKENKDGDFINILETIKSVNTIPENVKCNDINTYRIYELIMLLSAYETKSIKTNNNLYNSIIKDLISITIDLINRYLYLKRLEYENTKTKKKTLPLSKQILQDTNFIFQPEFLKRITKMSEINNESITMDTANNANQFIFLPKLMKKPGLSHMFGLFGRKIKNLLKNNNLNVCVSKLRFNIKNRSYDTKDFTTKNSSYILNKFYNIHNNAGKIKLYRTAITDIDINISQIVDELQKCSHRYYFILGSVISFNNNFFDKLVDNSHKISLLFDTEKKIIYFYNPMGNLSYLTRDIKLMGLHGCVLVLDHLFNSETTKFDYFKANIYTIYNNYNDYINEKNGIQDIEYNKKNIINVELKNIENYSKNIKGENIDWYGGYCGLWNLLLLSLLSINPNYNIHDILTFYNILINHAKSYGLVTKLIRSFAYHTEQLLEGKIKSIPIVRLNISDIKSDIKSDQKLKLKLRTADDVNLTNSDISIEDKESKEDESQPMGKKNNSEFNSEPFVIHKQVMPFIKETIKAFRGKPLHFNNSNITLKYKNSKKKKILFI